LCLSAFEQIITNYWYRSVIIYSVHTISTKITRVTKRSVYFDSRFSLQMCSRKSEFLQKLLRNKLCPNQILRSGVKELEYFKRINKILRSGIKELEYFKRIKKQRGSLIPRGSVCLLVCRVPAVF
jgi:hypothetical protein